METPIELLKKELGTRKLIASGRGFSRQKNLSNKLIPEYQKAISQLENYDKALERAYEKGYNQAHIDNEINS